MQIISVELHNIKSYRDAKVELRRGTTAIRGENGAGKSTIVEAIGWALFDALPYAQGQFIREGEKSGQVTVSFISAEDDRVYDVVRRAGSGAIWYVYDPELEQRAAEQHTDVVDFLRRHLRIEGDIALTSLFDDALGVPQGRLTADFLLTAAQRKKKFDALLQVEDFGKAAEKLAETRKHLRETLIRQDGEIERLEHETAALEDWRAQVVALRQRERELRASQVSTQRQLDEATRTRDMLLEREREVKRLEGERDVARVTHEAAAREATAAGTQRDEAAEAERICRETQSASATYERVGGALADARARAQTRDHRLKQRGDLEKALTSATADVKHARERLAQAEAAAARAAELAPRVAEQQMLSQRRQSLSGDVVRLRDARTALATREAESTSLASAITTTERAIAEIEKARPAASLLPERRQQLDALRADEATRAERQKRLDQLNADLRKLTAVQARKQAALEKAASNVRKLLDKRAEAEAFPALEAEERQVRGEAERLRITLEHHHTSRAQSVGGQCPFLREPCLNIQKRGMSSLETYFDGLIARDGAALAQLDARLAELEPRLEQGRPVYVYYARLDEYRERQTDAERELAESETDLAGMRAEQAQMSASLAQLGGHDELAQAVKLCRISEEAEGKLHQLAPRQSALAADRQRLAAVEGELEHTRALVAALAVAPDQLRATDEQLTALGDPQAEQAHQQGVAREHPAIAAELARLRTAQEGARQRVAEAEEALKPFAGLDEEIRDLEATHNTARVGHERYLRYRETAARLPERQRAFAQCERQARDAARVHESATRRHDEARAAFDAGALEAANQRYVDLTAELSRIAEELRNMSEKIEACETAIVRAEAQLAELETARGEHAIHAELEQMLEQFRGIIKEAGPYVMRALLRNISTEANHIFGDIIGDRAAQLAWEDDYEVVLRRGGQERHFAQLSGGEQMSAALAVRLALLRYLSRLDIAFFDEPTQNMDGERRGNLAEQLRRVHGFDQLIVISHDDTFEQGLDSVIHIQKRGGETVLISADEEALIGA